MIFCLWNHLKSSSSLSSQKETHTHIHTWHTCTKISSLARHKVMLPFLSDWSHSFSIGLYPRVYLTLRIPTSSFMFLLSLSPRCWQDLELRNFALAHFRAPGLLHWATVKCLPCSPCPLSALLPAFCHLPLWVKSISLTSVRINAGVMTCSSTNHLEQNA